MDMQLDKYAHRVEQKLLVKGLKLATAESCTGGWVSQLITEIPGSSQWFEGGVVAYSNNIKHRLLGVSLAMLEQHGAVSEAVAKAMAQGAVDHLRSDVALAITGIAGPGGGSPVKPVGTVWIGWALGSQVSARCFQFPGDRQAVRSQAVACALEGLADLLDNID